MLKNKPVFPKTALLLMLIMGFVLAPAGQLAGAQGKQVENCAVTPVQLMGQAYMRLMGAEGETEETIANPDIIADPNWIQDVVPVAGAGTKPVVILVIDEFPPSEQAGGAKKAPKTHGELVWEVLEQVLASLSEAGVNNIGMRKVNIAAGGSGNYKTNTIAKEVEKAINELKKEGVERIVLNMSFVIVPCQDGSFSHTDFVNSHRADPTKAIVTDLGNDGAAALLRKPKEGLDPLHDLIIKLNGQSTADGFAVMAIGAAGNFGEDEPFYPAGWPEVISVSASEGNLSQAQLWAYSNGGEIMTPGAWYLLEDGYYRAGTSFAAPVMSVVAGLYLSHETVPCSFTAGNAPLNEPGNFANRAFSEGLACATP